MIPTQDKNIIIDLALQYGIEAIWNTPNFLMMLENLKPTDKEYEIWSAIIKGEKIC